MKLRVKEIFRTLQGEGRQAGRPAIFCRFTGCNLWSGFEEHRATAVCKFCDTDFVGGDTHTVDSLVAALLEADVFGCRYVVFTGGEPLLQLRGDLLLRVKSLGFTVAVETNGTIAPPPGIDWLCVSPKGGAPLNVRSGNELKLVFPQTDCPPERFAGLDFEHFSLQPMDGPAAAQNTEAALRYCDENPQWWLSVQTHKTLGIR